MSTSSNQNSYDELPYPSMPYAQTHPNRLATVATLLGMTPTPVDNCRVLELGCAGGGNLVPMALALPNSRFVGIDYSARQIAQGHEMIQALGVGNISLKQMDILEVTEDLGQFDYIIAHGVYSWVPAAVRDAVLQICKQNLAANGIVYVSYNTLPGWSMLSVVRNIMLYHTRNITNPRERVAQARKIVDYIEEAIPGENNAYGSFMRTYNRLRIREREEKNLGDDAFLLHDELEDVNYPVYFHQFAEHAAQHGLQYLGDTQFAKMMPSQLSTEVLEAFDEMSNSVIDFEQYLDFLTNRTFRRTLLCHENVELSRKLNPGHLVEMHIAVAAMPGSAEIDVAAVSVEEFKGSDDAVFSTDHPVTKAALVYAGKQWPHTISFRDLFLQSQLLLNSLGVSRQMLHENTQRDAEVLATNLLTAYGYSPRLVDLHVHPPEFTLEISQRPVASPLARWQVSQGMVNITSLRHERVNLGRFNRAVLTYLDGKHNTENLVDALVGQATAGELTLELNDQPVTELAQVEQAVQEMLQQHLPQLAEKALLVS